ncbi:MAG: hypothetical protein DWQ07_04285 [Chloroflexi bacterium]|nr:MAG: hypothetical protein DWQ07_04285 [Chloroflexota bacterium]MBL1194651.1 hypothetical protein [Chloroflexota bacterium]NOH11941.1 hypothetical protein [Chloroflexota bacterium]
MSDMVKSCLGVVLLFVAIGMALVVLASATLAAIIFQFTGTDISGLQFPTLIGIGLAIVLFIYAIYLFISIRDYSWLSVTIPGVLSGLYAILPDLLMGQPTDDIVVLVAGAGLSALLAYRKQRRETTEALEAGESLLNDRLGQ